LVAKEISIYLGYEQKTTEAPKLWINSAPDQQQNGSDRQKLPRGPGAYRYGKGKKKRVVDFLVKYVRPGKEDGIYLPEVSGEKSVLNWTPDSE